MKIRNVILLLSLVAFVFVKNSFCRMTSSPDNPSGDESMTVSKILRGMQEAAENFNRTLENLQVTQTTTLKSTILGDAKITKLIRFQRPDIIEEKVLEEEKKVKSGVQMNIDDSVSCVWFIEPLISSLAEENYHIRLIGQETINGQPAYVLKVKPKDKKKSFIKGDFWIDMRDLVPIKYEGKPLKKIDEKSAKGKQIIEYEKIDDTYWLPILNRLEASWLLMIKIVNETTFSGYEVNSESSE